MRMIDSPKPEGTDISKNSISMTEYAERPGMDFLKRHIEIARPLYENLCLSDDSFRINFDTREVSIALIPNDNLRTSEHVIHGGVTAALIDACSGALGAVLAGEHMRVFTKTHNIRYIRPIEPNVEMTVRAEMVTDTSGSCEIRTIVMQKGKRVALGLTDLVKLSAEKTK